MRKIKNYSLLVSASFIIGFPAGMAYAFGGAGQTNFSVIASNITASISDLPSLVGALGYLFGIVLGVTGILKIRDHVESPGQTPLKDGAIRLLAGGGLFALPMIYDAMLVTIGAGGSGDVAPTLAPLEFAGGSEGGGGRGFDANCIYWC